MDVLDKPLGKEGSVKLVVSGGKISITAGLDTKGVDVSTTVGVDVDYFLDELAKKIPGTIDDSILSVVKIALKAL